MNTSVDSIPLPNNLENTVSDCVRGEIQLLEEVCVDVQNLIMITMMKHQAFFVQRAKETQHCQGALEDANSLKLGLRRNIHNLEYNKEKIVWEVWRFHPVMPAWYTLTIGGDMCRSSHCKTFSMRLIK